MGLAAARRPRRLWFPIGFPKKPYMRLRATIRAAALVLNGGMFLIGIEKRRAYRRPLLPRRGRTMR